MTIFRYPLTSHDCTLLLPKGARVLVVHEQRHSICLWTLIDPEEPLVSRRFIAYGTGDLVDEGSEHGTYLGTACVGALVWHVFEVALRA